MKWLTIHSPYKLYSWKEYLIDALHFENDSENGSWEKGKMSDKNTLNKEFAFTLQTS